MTGRVRVVGSAWNARLHATVDVLHPDVQDHQRGLRLADHGRGVAFMRDEPRAIPGLRQREIQHCLSIRIVVHHDNQW